MRRQWRAFLPWIKFVRQQATFNELWSWIFSEGDTTEPDSQGTKQWTAAGLFH